MPTDWGNYYAQLKAAYAGGTPPDVHVMHRHRVPEFAGIGALADLTDDLAAVGIDPSDWEPAAVDAVTYNDASWACRWIFTPTCGTSTWR